MRETVYMIQPAFTTGEVSPEVASRIDLNQYTSALLTAKNAYIRPYGPVYKRGGTIYCGQAKYPDKKVMLYPFTVSAERSFMLEIGDKYIRIWNGDTFTGLELATPWGEDELPNLRFCQSADVMYIASGSHPVMTLSHYADNDFRLAEFKFSSQYFDSSMETTAQQSAEESWKTAGTFSYTCKESGEYSVTLAGAGGGNGGTGTHVKKNENGDDRILSASGGAGGRGAVTTGTVWLTEGTVYTIVVGAPGTTPQAKDYTGDNGTAGGNTTAFGFSAQGGEGGQGGYWTGKRKQAYSYSTRYRKSYTAHTGADGTSYGNGGAAGAPGWVTIHRNADIILTPSGTDGEITLSASRPFFTEKMNGAWLQLKQDMPAQTISLNEAGTTDAIKVCIGWKIITHGTWTGSVKIQKSIDGGEWKDFREYKSNNDNNVSESGTVNEGDNIRMRLVTTAGRADLTSLAYTATGTVEITNVISDTQARCIVRSTLGSTEKAISYTMGVWSEEFGYPHCVCFFQDRLCFANTAKQPFMVWMSKTGDYNNFSVEKVSGTVTDDSAVAISFVSRSQQSIKHLLAGKDLIVLTDGNEWTVSGSETVKPSKATPQVQASRGTTDIIPVMIGNRIIFVQRRAETVRDTGYSFESDAYSGIDLTLLAKSLTRGKKITSAAYMQDPDSRLYFVENDGTINCLAYVQDQKVYAWSHLATDGQFESVCNIVADEDSVYTAVRRTINGKPVTYIERFFNNAYTDRPMDYAMLDAAAIITSEEDMNGGQVPHLAGKKTQVLSEGRYYDVTIDADGSFNIPNPTKKMIVGLPYEMRLEVPNIETQTQQGTLQGRNKKIAAVIFRLVNSLGGYVGNNKTLTDQIKYDELQKQKITLYSGDKEITMPNTPGFGTEGRVLITSKDPYPFNLVALIREMVVSG